MSDVAVSVRGLGKRYRIWTHARPTNLKERVALSAGSFFARATNSDSPALRRDIWALRDVSFDVGRGEVFGVIGPNGAGKSTLLAILARVTEPTEGLAELRGRTGSLLEVGTGFHPELTGRDNVFLNGAVLGMSRAETARKFDEILDFAELHDFVDVPVKRYSTGMYMRLAFAVAAHLDPEILLVDEVLSVGDQDFQEKSLRRIEELTRSGRTVIFVSHDVHSVSRLCTRAVVIRGGRLAFTGAVDEAVEQYLDLPREVGGGYLGDVPRAGSGDLRFLHVAVGNADGHGAIVAGGDVSIRIAFAAPRPVSGRNLDLELVISSPLAGELASLSTALGQADGLRAVEIGHNSTVVCEIEDIPLRPGKYLLSLTARRLGEVLDRVENQVEFVVEAPFDPEAAAETHAPVLVRHRWRVAEVAVSGRGS